jgi:glycine cleavage system H protein
VKVPEGLKYTEEHEWVKVEGNVGIIGITDYAQSELGDLTYVELPKVGDEFSKGDTVGGVESMKAYQDLFTPVSGKIVEVNEAFLNEDAGEDDNPFEKVKNDPYGDGWMLKIELNDPSELDSLMDTDAYKGII